MFCVPKSKETSNKEVTIVNKNSPIKEAAVNTNTQESSNDNLNLAMDQDAYKQRLRELRVSREELRYLMQRFPVELLQELGSQGV